ncbi:MAG: haloacid dehalogenase-like hydrolase [Clostridia bacterium]|nr:haloacid dehalogenase-like hydrolase [Clostridia bacterium]
MKRKSITILLFCAVLLLTLASCTTKGKVTIPYWEPDSDAMLSIVSFVSAVTDEKSESFVPESERIAVFDMDGTLYGERFPTYFDDWMLIHRLAHDGSYRAAAEDRAWAFAAEAALLSGEPEPDSPRSGAQMAAEAFKGFTVEEYRAYVRAFMDEPAVGFEGMTYGEGFFLPMVELVKYLSENGFTVFISSGSERSIVRELTADALSEWIPPYHIIGSTFSLEADGQGDTEGRKYTYKPEDDVRLEGNLISKNQKMNKVTTIIDEIGAYPLLVFGNSSGDISMAQYAVQHGGRAYMLLCDDTERDYGDPKEAAEFEENCKALGFITISMRDEFETIYKPGAVKAEQALQPAA